MHDSVFPSPGMMAEEVIDAACPHTGKPLHPLSEPGDDFGISDEGAVYYLGARTLEYASDYFLKEYENQYGRTYFADESSLRALAKRRIGEIARHIPPPARILEIGCAAGYFLAEAETAGYTAAGFDISEYATQFARERLGVDARTATLAEFRPNDGGPVFDAVAAYYVLEHMPDQRYAFSRISSLLRNGGIFSFAIPSTNGPLFRDNSNQWRRTHPADHFADYSPESLKRILPHYGMRLLSVRPSSYHHERLGKWNLMRLLPPLYRLYANLFIFGDTIEGIAVKTGQ